jgi:acetyl esterase/lipase
MIKSTIIAVLTFAVASCAGDRAAASAAPTQKQTVVYKRVGDLEIKADVYHFTDDRIRPVVVWLHGGALIMGNRGWIDTRVKNEALTNGFVVVSFDYRLAPQTKLPGIIEDLEDCFRWLRREGAIQFHIDPDRIAVMGVSAGGYLTLVSGFRIEPRPRVLVAFYGYGDLIGDWYSTPSKHPRHNKRKITEAEAWQSIKGPEVSDGLLRKNASDFYDYCRQTGQWPKLVSGWDSQREPEKYFPYMPVKNVTHGYPPSVLIHGTVDTDVPFELSQMMARQFQKHDVPHQFHVITNAEHGLYGGSREEIDQAYRKMFEFVKTRLTQP